MKFAISTKNEVLKFGEVRSSSSPKSLFATQQGDNPEALVLQLDGPFDQKTGGKGANVARAVDLARSVGGEGTDGVWVLTSWNSYYRKMYFQSQKTLVLIAYPPFQPNPVNYNLPLSPASRDSSIRTRPPSPRPRPRRARRAPVTSSAGLQIRGSKSQRLSLNSIPESSNFRTF